MDILWTNIIAGDKDAYSKVYVSLYKRFYNYGLKFTEDVAIVEDALQEILLTVWTSREKLAGISNPEGYFFSSFRNLLFNKMKNIAKYLPVDHVEWEPVFSPESIIINKELTLELQKKLENALGSLTSRQREAIFLRFYEGLSYQEVAEILNISVKATYKIVGRALVQLKDNLSLPIIYILFLLRGFS